MTRLSKTIKRLNSTYALYFNERHERDGHLFQGRFKSDPVDTDEYYLTVLRYIHQNPVRAGLKSTCEYTWSSYLAYCHDARAVFPGLVDTSFALEMIGGEEAFRRFHEYVDVNSACCDIEWGRQPVCDDFAIAVARAVLGAVRPEAVVGLPRLARDEAIRKLKAAHLSVRQIERITRVPRSVVSRC